MHLTRVIVQPGRFPTPDAYPFNLPLVQRTRVIDFPTPVTFFTGENGTGKSTLLEAICRCCRIHIWEGMERRQYQVNRYEKMLPEALDIQWADGPVPGSFFSPELFRNFSQLVDEWAVSSPGLLDYFGGRSLVTQSHGQSCMAFFRSIYAVKGLHFMDEPEAALSPKTQLRLLELLTQMSRTGHAQFIISTHSPILMACPQATLYSFDNESVGRISYKETQHYQVYKTFFETV
ncbi:MAG: AAA family ATPase [Desulfobacteraceae bacterium]|nr:MAG: AAA family ATPase [Desulfobacteraceae bacterium]